MDLILFAGQSNMAGRGQVSEMWPQKAPKLIDGAGWEFRAISTPNKLSPIEEPFGVDENREDGIWDVYSDGKKAKTGSMVSAFCNAYYEKTKVPVVAVSASKGGSNIGQWQENSAEGYLLDSVKRWECANTFLEKEGYKIRHRYLIWCQGESDGDLQRCGEEYKEMFLKTWNRLKQAGMEHCFLIKIGDCNIPDAYDRYLEIQRAQEELAAENEDISMASRAFCGMRKRGLMKDAFHYYQQGYNECGTAAGKFVGETVWESLRKN